LLFALLHPCAQDGNGARELIAARGSFADPKWNVRRLTLSVRDPDHSWQDLQDAVTRVPELEHIPAHGFDSKVLVDSAHHEIVRIEAHLVVEGVGDGATVRDGGQTSAATTPENVGGRVVVEIGSAPSALGGEPLREEFDQSVEGLPCEL